MTRTARCSAVSRANPRSSWSRSWTDGYGSVSVAPSVKAPGGASRRRRRCSAYAAFHEEPVRPGVEPIRIAKRRQVPPKRRRAPAGLRRPRRSARSAGCGRRSSKILFDQAGRQAGRRRHDRPLALVSPADAPRSCLASSPKWVRLSCMSRRTCSSIDLRTTDRSRVRCRPPDLFRRPVGCVATALDGDRADLRIELRDIAR